jgi:hypothetical protein
MDGVISDFSKRYEELYGETPERHDSSKKFNKNFSDFIEGGHFATLDPMPGMMLLVDFLRKAPVPTEILSSTAREDRHHEIARQKMVWLQTHGITFKPNFVPGKKLKKNYASMDSLIIDDTESVIGDWMKEGGHTIWHQNVPSTLAILKTMF